MKTSQKRSISSWCWPKPRRSSANVRSECSSGDSPRNRTVTRAIRSRDDRGRCEYPRSRSPGRTNDARAFSSITGSASGSRRSASPLPIRPTKRSYSVKQPSAMCWPLSGGGGGSPSRSGSVWTAPPSVGRASWRTTSWPASASSSAAARPASPPPTTATRLGRADGSKPPVEASSRICHTPGARHLQRPEGTALCGEPHTRFAATMRSFVRVASRGGPSNTSKPRASIRSSVAR